MKRIYTIFFSFILCLPLLAYTKVTVEDPENWAYADLKPYVGDTITFTTPFYVCNNYKGNLDISPRRTFTPTNQVFPGTSAYRALLAANKTSEVTLSGISGYHRMGEKIENLTVYVSSTTYLKAIGAQQFVGNTHADLEKGYPSVDLVGNHTLLVCAFNLEYYLVENLGTGYGPENASQATKQHTKVMDALMHIQADVFGFVEIEQGQAALQKLAQALTQQTGKNYSWINDGGSASSSYTKAGYVYCTETVKPYGKLQNNDSGVKNRKKMQAFTELATNETFIFSLNHFKAKGRGGTGDNADQGDGQGSYNGDRVREAESVLSNYATNRNFYKDDDILIMGDLNAYAKEDPIITLLDGGMTDLHRYFHADSAYSYTYHGQAGYLDHALANATMLPQITGVQAYHINSDESDEYTYNQSNDLTMFRSSDHDPVLVGLALGQTADIPVLDEDFEACKLFLQNGKLYLQSAKNGYYRVFDMMGNLLTTAKLHYAEEQIDLPTQQGVYIIQVFVDNQVKTFKICN